jgi:alkanesulfonate monooxygenase SsuD/methylene tetrahydromethanopterin reductase-like flavin-dependent oxidoreductase (luciferase family)
MCQWADVVSGRAACARRAQRLRHAINLHVCAAATDERRDAIGTRTALDFNIIRVTVLSS